MERKIGIVFRTGKIEWTVARMVQDGVYKIYTNSEFVTFGVDEDTRDELVFAAETVFGHYLEYTSDDEANISAISFADVMVSEGYIFAKRGQK